MSRRPSTRPGKRRLACVVTITLLAAAFPALSDVAGAEVAAADDAEPSSEQTDVDRSGTWIGEIDGTDVAVAVVSDGKVVRAYACNGAEISAWFEGELVGNSFAISAPDGSTITGALTDGGATGTLSSTDGLLAGSFSATRPTAGGGVFRSYFVTSDAAPVFIRWIVFDDGTQRGNAETTTADGAVTSPAPPLDVEAARTQSTVPVAPAGGPAPVVELTPVSITAPIPTTVIAGAPPPIPSPTPPAVQPLVVTAKVTPPKADLGTPVRYQLALTNPNKTELTDAGVRVGLPPGLAVQPNTDKTTCKGTFAAFPPGTTKPGNPSLIVSKVTLAAGASCTADVDIGAAVTISVDVVTDAPTAAGAPPGKPARVTFVIGSTAVVSPTPTTTQPTTTTTTKPTGATTTTKPGVTTTTTPARITALPPPARAPGAPREVEVRALLLGARDGRTGGRIDVGFLEPADDGGSPITRFAARCTSPVPPPVGSAPIDLVALGSGSSSPVTVTGVQVDLPFTCSVTATNEAGLIGPPAFAKTTAKVLGRPEPPRDVTATAQPLGTRSAQDGRIDVSFSPPEEKGAPPITGFVARCTSNVPAPKPGEFVELFAEGSASASPVTVPGIVSDFSYECSVAAVNQIGEGLGIRAARVAVRGSPAAVTDVKADPLELRAGDGPNNGRLRVSFATPDDGAPRATSFSVSCVSPDAFRPGTAPTKLESDADGTASPVTVPGIRVDRNYTCSVIAFNQVGRGLAAFAPKEFVPGRPGRPLGIELDPVPLGPGDGPDSGRVKVSFRAPEDNGSPPVTSFAVRCDSPTTNAAGTPTNLLALAFGVTSSPVTVTGFRVDHEYRCTVAATNRIGEGSEQLAAKKVTVTAAPVPTTTAPTSTTGPTTTSTTTPINATPPSPPPGQPVASPVPPQPGDGQSDGRITVEFATPERNGGSPITGYVVTCTANGTTSGAASAKESPITVTNLPTGFRYPCVVQAENAIGLGEPSRPSNLVPVPIPPSVQQPPSRPPGHPVASALPPKPNDGPSDGRIEVEFFESEKNGGSEITGYVATCTDNANFSIREAEKKSPITVTGIPYGFRYTCVVEAENAIGPSDPSRPSNAVPLPIPPSVQQVPGRPREVVAEAVPPQPGAGPSDGQVVVRFIPPETDGGSKITGYEVACTDNQKIGVSGSGLESPIPLTGFPAGSYVCFVRAVNDIGPSNDSRSTTAIVRAPPVVPKLAVAPASGSAPLSATFALENAPEKIASWKLDFGDGTPTVQGQGAVPVVPHTYVNKTDLAITLNASLSVTPAGDKVKVLTAPVQVHPPGTVLTLDGAPKPKELQRGAEGEVALAVGNPNAAPVAGPLTVSTPSATSPGIKVKLVGSGWVCGETSCTLATGLEGFEKAPPLLALVDAPVNAPATLEVPFEVSGGASARAQTIVRIPVVGVFANAGPDQTVDATTPAPDGSLVPTHVLLDAGASLGLDGKSEKFSWRRVSGAPAVALDTKADPTGRIVTFDAPPVTSETAYEFELTVTQGATESKDRVRVTVFPRNQPPVLQKIVVSGLATQTRKGSGEVVPQGRGTLKLTTDAADPDGDKLVTSWRVLTEAVPNGAATGDAFSLEWPVPHVAQVIVEATVTDPRGAHDTLTVTIGVAPDPLGLAVTAPARVDAGTRVSAHATPSRRAGVDVRWGVVSGTAPAGFPKAGPNITFNAPDLSASQIITLEVTAIETATGATATRQIPLQVDAPPPLVVSAPPSVSVDRDEQTSIEASAVGGSNPSFEWRQTFGPNVTLNDDHTRTVRFRAPSDDGTIGLRLTVTGSGVTRTTDTVVTVGSAAPALASGCGGDSAYQQLANGGVVVFGGIAVLSGVNAQGTDSECGAATLDGVDVNLLDGLVVGENLSGTFDQDTVRFTGGDVHLPAAFELPTIDLGAAPLEIAFDGGGGATASGGAGASCINWDAGFASNDFPFVPLPPGFSSAGATLAVSCAGASINAEATAGGATFAVEAALADGGANATATLTNVPALGGTASGTGSITIAPGGAATYDLTATIANPSLPVPGLALTTATARLTPAGLTVSAEGSLGQGSGALAVTMEGAFAPTGLSLAVEANNNAPWQVGPGLTVDAANLIGTIDVDEIGTATVDLRLSVSGDWRPVPGLRVRQLSLQVANTAVPPDCAIPAGGAWVRVSGEGAIEIPTVSPIALAVEACLGLPSGSSTPPFSLRSTVGGPQWQVAPGVVISNVGIQVSLIGPTLTLQASGGATLLGLDLTARVVFLVPTGGGQPTIVVDASGSLSGLGIPIPSGHVVFASAAVPDFEIEPGLALDLPQGITGVGSIDLGQPVANLLNDAFSPPTPILARVTVTVSFGTTIEIKAAINLGGAGATLFIGCPGGGTSCDPTAPTTTRLALTSAFIRLVLGGAGGFTIGFGGDGTLNLPPAEEGGAASPLDLHIEASIQPPARVGLTMFFQGAWQNAMGVSGLTLANLGIQGSIDFSTTPVPLVTIGITGQVNHVPNGLANVLGLTNNGEPMRFTANIDPLAPILELTLGVDDSEIVMRPLAALGQADALEVDFASVVLAPLGGTVGPVTYSPGISAGFAANIMGVPVHVNASVDIPAAHLNGTVEIGTLTIGGVRFEDTTVLLDITPQRFRQTLCGGVHIGSTTLQGLLHIQAGAGGGGAATCGDVTLDTGGSGAGLRARFRLHAASLPVGPVNMQELTVDAQANLDALSANFNATLNVTATLNVLANNLDVDGTIKFGTTGVQELHVKAIGNVNVGGVQITGDGTCGFPPAAATTFTFASGGRGKSIAAQAPTSGACVQLDHAPGTSTPFRFGLKGKLKAAGSTASVTGTLDQSQASLSGQLNVPTLGNLDISGTLVFGSGAQIANATGTNVNASPGDWRVGGQFGTAKSLAGGVSAQWVFAAGRVSGGLFVRGSASVAIGGATVSLAGTFSANSSGALTYSLSGSSSAAVDSNVNLGEVNAIHTAVRGVFLLPGQRASDERLSDIAQLPPRFTRGRLYFTASYAVDATLTQNGLDINEADLSARVRYAERFDRTGTFGDAFTEESSSRWNTIVNFNIDASGIDEFFEMAVGDAATRTHAPDFCFTVFAKEFGNC